MKKIIALNWKMNPSSLKETQKIASIFKNLKFKIENLKIIICPPFVYLDYFSNFLQTTKITLGAQDLFWKNPPRQLAGDGAYTGEISGSMLKNLDVKYVIVGHSERRKWLDETDEIVNKKIESAIKAGLKVILCIGENAQIRKKGLKAVKLFIKTQLQKDLRDLKAKSFKLKANLVIAYEPIWAIGTGKYCNPKDALEIIKFIKQILNAEPYALTPKILYGGSVNSKNILDFIKYPEIDGVLVGGASVDLKELKNIFKLI